MISRSKKVLFIHIPKTGGNSIQDALREHIDDEVVTLNALQDGVERFQIRNKSYKGLHKHSSLSDYDRALGDKISEYTIYATLRNPFDKLVSFYFSPHRGNIEWDLISFKKFIKKIKPLDFYVKRHKGFLFRKEPPPLNIEFLHFENLEYDFQKLCLKHSFPEIILHKRNKSKRRDYRECYDEESINWVLERHKTEIKLGKYKF